MNGWNDSVKGELEELSKEHGVNSLKVDLTGFSGTEEVLRCLESCKDLGLAVHAAGYNGTVHGAVTLYNLADACSLGSVSSVV